MKPKHLFVQIAVLWSSIAFIGTPTQAASITIDVLTTFDYPGAGNSTLPQKINDAGDIAGYYIDSSGVTRGFVRTRTGAFSPPIVEPNDTGNRTEVRGINNLRTLCGSYLADNFSHGFFLSATTLTEFDVTGAVNTYIDAINDAGDFGGTYDTNPGNQGYLSIAGSVVSFSVPGALTTTVFGLNNSDQSAGDYLDSASVSHGFFRDTDGTLTFPIDPSGSTQTILFGINDRGWMVGRDVDSAGATHALFYQTLTRFIVFDYPGSTFTSFNGINRQGLICGRYQDASNLGHGIIARVRRIPAD